MLTFTKAEKEVVLSLFKKALNENDAIVFFKLIRMIAFHMERDLKE